MLLSTVSEIDRRYGSSCAESGTIDPDVGASSDAGAGSTGGVGSG
jgi:hypothetical protein